jgi:proline racemase
LVLSGGPDLGGGPIVERRERLRARHDEFRRAIVTEPRGSGIGVGALLLPPVDPSHRAGVVFFNNAGYLGMCGHGTIGVVASLQHLGQLATGRHRFETPVGLVDTELRADGSVAIDNVVSYRLRADVSVNVPEYGTVSGEIAWGGNWFFLTERLPAELRRANVPELHRFATAVRGALDRDGIRDGDGGPIEHVELSGPPRDPRHHGRNFVLCPGGEYDRSPCGTGTSAKLACLVAAGRLRAGETWFQEGILDGVFECSVATADGGIRPRIAGRAHVTGEGDLVLDDADPLRFGVPS